MSEHGTPIPTRGEAEFFVREDAEKMRRLAQETKKRLQAAELERLKKLHWMRCPKCGLELHGLPMRGVHVDVCMSCGGVWLDHGELEKIQQEPRPGLVSAFINWFQPETKAPRR